ncbi:hypothetical protein H0H92_007790 [Tricholoma furcatifolium]|nr:hypothetical protein H0H92_007790 [Tricholoma furcatifolium]
MSDSAHRTSLLDEAISPVSEKKGFRQRMPRSAGRTIWHHLKRHTGVGIVCAVAYFDPGNWGVDLQAGSQYGYSLLFIVLLSGLFAVFLQVLASKLGCVTGLDLASHCRVLLHSRPKHTLLFRWLALYPLYLLSEIAIIATDLSELLGSAIALCLLFPQLELWQGVLITTLDVFALLLLKDPLGGRPVRSFELLIAGMVMAILICLVVIIARVEVNWGKVFDGYLPSKNIFSPGALYTWATVMPHSLYLGSALATQDRESDAPRHTDGLLRDGTEISEMLRVSDIEAPLGAKSRLYKVFRKLREIICALFRKPLPSEMATEVKRHSDRENRPYAVVKAHIYHASAVFYYESNQYGNESPASLFDAYDLIHHAVGKGAATLFAIALLASGQSSSIIATVAGQAVAEGFLHWRTSPAMRRIVTRLIAIIPSMVVAVAVGRSGIDTLLVASQVVLSIVLPFVIIPLVYCTSSKSIMSVRKPFDGLLQTAGPLEDAPTDEIVDFSSGWFATGIGCAICLLVIAANVYVLASLGMGS